MHQDGHRRLIGLLMATFIADLATAAPAIAQARPIARAQLPASVRTQLDRGALIRLSAGRPDTVPKNVAAPLLAPGEALAARTGDSAILTRVSPKAANHAHRRPSPMAGVDTTFALPYTFVGFDQAGETPAYQPVYIAEGGLQYQPATDDFEGDFLIRLDLVDGSGDSVSLARSIGLTFGGDADSIVPGAVQFGYTGGMYQRVRVVAHNARDSLRVQVVPQFDPKGVSIWMIVKPTLTFETPPASIQGYGIETATLVIGTRGVTSRDSFDVTVNADRGTLSAHTLRLGPSGGVVTLRSAGALGPVTVRAVSPTLGSADTSIRYAWPVRFALAALLGAILGAVYASLAQSRKSGSRATARQVAGAALGAILATAIYIGLGISLIPVASGIPMGNEIAVFAFAALGAIAGIKLPAPSGPTS